MTIREFQRAVREQWLIVLVVTAIGVIGGLTVYLVRPVQYTAQVALYVSAQAGDSSGSAALDGAQLSADRVKSYVVMATSRRVSAEVVRRLGLSESPTDLSSRTSASSPLDSVLVDIAVVDQSPQRAADLANTFGAVFTELVADVERPIGTAARPVVAARVSDPAAPPEDPSSLGVKVLVALGLLIGLSVGVVAAIVRNALDTSITSAESLGEITGAPVLGSIAFDPEATSRPLTINDRPLSARSEAFRRLRTNLRFVEVDRPHKIIIISSPMPSEGKTTTVINLATAMAAAGNRVLLVDGDLRRPTVGQLLGVETSVGLTSVLAGQIQVGPAIQRWDAGGFDALTSGRVPPNPGELLASEHMERVLLELREKYDVVLIDSAPLLPVSDTVALAPKTDGVILVGRYNKTTRPQLEAAVTALSAVSSPLLGGVLTMTPRHGRRGAERYAAYYGSDHVLPMGSQPAQSEADSPRPEPPPAARPSPRPRPSSAIPLASRLPPLRRPADTTPAAGGED